MTNSGLNSAEQYICDLLTKNSRVLFGDELKEVLISKFGKSEVAARKLISRITEKSVISSTAPISFGRKTYGYHSIHRKLTLEDIRNLAQLRRPPLFRLISALIDGGGILSYYEALKITASPIEPSTTKVSSLDSLIKDLQHFNFIKLKTDLNNVKYILTESIKEIDINTCIARHYSEMVVDSIFLQDVLLSLKKLNIIDNEKVVYRNRRHPSLGAKHNNFVWDAFAYSKTTGIATSYTIGKVTNKQTALVVLDVVVSRSYKSFDLDGFLARIQILKNNTKTERKLLPVIVFQTIGKETLNRARSFGLISYDMSSFFGSNIDEIIKNVSAVKLKEGLQSPTGDNSVQLINDSLAIIEQSGNKINLQNVIGDFFQSLMFQLFNHIYRGSNIGQAKKLPATDRDPQETKKYEYDFVIFPNNRNEVVVVEVKGYSSESYIKLGDYNTKNSLKWFFGRTFPSAKKYYSDGFTKDYQIKSVFVTSAKFENEGIKFLESLSRGKQKPTDIEVAYDGKSLLKLVELHDLGLLKETLERYFIIPKKK